MRLAVGVACCIALFHYFVSQIFLRKIARCPFCLKGVGVFTVHIILLRVIHAMLCSDVGLCDSLGHTVVCVTSMLCVALHLPECPLKAWPSLVAAVHTAACSMQRYTVHTAACSTLYHVVVVFVTLKDQRSHDHTAAAPVLGSQVKHFNCCWQAVECNSG